MDRHFGLTQTVRMAATHRAWLCLVVVLTLQTLPQAHGFFPIFKRKPKPKPLPPPEAGNMEARPAFPPVARTTYDPYLYGQQRLRTEAESATDEAFERLGASINVNQNPKDYVDLIKVCACVRACVLPQFASHVARCPD